MKQKTIVRAVVSTISSMALILAPTTKSWATGAIAGATEPTQIANNVELVMQYAKQIEQYATQLKQYQDQIQNTLNIPNQIWSAIESDLKGIMSIVQQGEALAFSMQNIGQQFQIKFPGFKKTEDFIKDYKNWSQTLRDTIKGTLEAANLQSQQFASEEGVIRQLRSMSQSNQGRLQALQTGNQIAVEVAAQMQKLRALTMAQLQAQTAYIAKTEQEKDTKQAAIDDLMFRGKLKDGKKYKPE